MTPKLNELGNEVRQHCECCSLRLFTATATIGHKWTKEEIEAEISNYAREIAYASWFNRGDIARKLRHWIEKLDLCNEFLMRKQPGIKARDY